MSANASANGTGITMTAKGYLEAQFHWPYVDNTN